MTTAPFLNPVHDPEGAYRALLLALNRMCAHDPLVTPDKNGASPELLPAPHAVVRESGYIALTAQQAYQQLPSQPYRITRGDTIIVEPRGEYGPGDTVLVASPHDEVALVGIRENGSFCWMADIDDDFDPNGDLFLGVVVEVRKARGPRLITPVETATPAPLQISNLAPERAPGAAAHSGGSIAMLRSVLHELGTRNEGDDWLPELLPAPWAVSRCPDDTGRSAYLPNAFAMVVMHDVFEAPNRRGWKIAKGDVLVFTTQDEPVDFPDDVFLVLQGAELTLADANLASLRDGSEIGGDPEVIARAIQHRPLGQIGGGL